MCRKDRITDYQRHWRTGCFTTASCWAPFSMKSSRWCYVISDEPEGTHCYLLLILNDECKWWIYFKMPLNSSFVCDNNQTDWDLLVSVRSEDRSFCVWSAALTTWTHEEHKSFWAPYEWSILLILTTHRCSPRRKELSHSDRCVLLLIQNVTFPVLPLLRFSPHRRSRQFVKKPLASLPLSRSFSFSS